MQLECFYRAELCFAFSGIADGLLLPFGASVPFLGQCRRFAFTVWGFISLFGAKQTLCFYPLEPRFQFSGNADALLLPFGASVSISGQCRRVASTVWSLGSLFRTLQVQLQPKKSETASFRFAFPILFPLRLSVNLIFRPACGEFFPRVNHLHRVSADECARWDVLMYECPGGDDRAVANCDSRHDR